MNLPTLVDYRDAVQNPQSVFHDRLLRSGVPRSNQLGLPTVASGGFALTFKIDVRSTCYAVRCFHKEGNQLQQRYAHIAEFVRDNPDISCLADVDYLPAGIRVHGADHPIVRMPWVDGVPLSDWVETHLHEPAKIESVRARIRSAVDELHRAGVAHGDLQHGNILVDDTQNVRFVDYDGMFLPALRELGAAEQGHRNYQHPARGDNYDTSIDLFAAHVIDLSLAGLQHDPALWKQFNTGENLLLSASDFHDPGASAVLDRLTRISATADPAHRLARACETDFDAVPRVLGGSTSAPHRPSNTGRRVNPHGPTPVSGHDADALRGLAGEVITVFGKVTDVKAHAAGNSNINFGDYRHGAFTIVAFGKASRDLKERYGQNLHALRGKWVSATGLITLYNGKRSNGLTPQVELYRLNPFHELTAEQAEKLQKPAPENSDAAEQPPARAREDRSSGEDRHQADVVSNRQTTSTPTDIDAKLGALYTSSALAHHITPTPRPPQQAPPPPQARPGQQPRRPQSPQQSNTSTPQPTQSTPNASRSKLAAGHNSTPRPPNEPGAVDPKYATYHPPPSATGPLPPPTRPSHTAAPPPQTSKKKTWRERIRRWLFRS